MSAPADTDTIGLGIRPKDEWPKSVSVEEEPIDKLLRDDKGHARVLSYLLSRIYASEDEMVSFYARWAANEKHIQAYINLEEWEKTLEEMNDSGEAPKVVSIIIPYTYATITTITTFLLHIFTGRKPMFQVGTYKEETVENARNLETVLQYNADHIGLIKEIWQFLQDSQAYGLGVMRTSWNVEKRMRTRSVPGEQQLTMFGTPLDIEPPSRFEREETIVYEGNEVVSQDPFQFFPDPRVPMTEVAERGEYVFWRTYEGRHTLLKGQAQGIYKGVDKIKNTLPRMRHQHIGGISERVSLGTGHSDRSLRAGGTSTPGEIHTGGLETQAFIQVDEGTVEIIPRELGLGTSELPEKWIFTIGNQNQIIRAEPFNADHDEHPVVVTEPLSSGYGFGHLGLADYLRPLQDAISWLFNSHMNNVKRVLNDVLIVDPSMVEMQDLKDFSEGSRIRLKQAAYGRDVRTMIQQLAVQDVTRSHIDDMKTLFFIGAMITGADENFMGLQDSGGRKTATEVRTSAESGGSRHVATTRVMSAQAMTHLTKQMSLNLQQFLSDDFYVMITGADGARAPINKSDVLGTFNFPIHDGTLPLDRVAMVDVWKEILQVIVQDQELRQNYSVPKIFEFIAELGGARNIEAMRLNVQPQQVIEDGLQQGNIVSSEQAAGLTPAAQRAAGGF